MVQAIVIHEVQTSEILKLRMEIDHLNTFLTNNYKNSKTLLMRCSREVEDNPNSLTISHMTWSEGLKFTIWIFPKPKRSKKRVKFEDLIATAHPMSFPQELSQRKLSRRKFLTTWSLQSKWDLPKMKTLNLSSALINLLDFLSHCPTITDQAWNEQ